MKKQKEAERGENGFVLISAVWLLLLGAAIVAAISLIALKRAESIGFERQQIERRLALESAYQTVIADILFNGPRSEFAKLPTTADYNLAGIEMKVSISSELGKLDINQTDLALIERALRGLGVAETPRRALLGELSTLRQSNETIRNIPDMAAVMQKAGVTQPPSQAVSNFCAARYFTVHSGLPRPINSQMAPDLANALAEPQLQENGAYQPGSSLRITVAAGEGPPLVAIARISGRFDQPIAVLYWRHGPDCATKEAR